MDKHIPIAIILGMIIQTAAAVWYIATFTAVTNQRLLSLEHTQVDITTISKQFPERIVKLEAQQAYTNMMLAEILTELKAARK